MTITNMLKQLTTILISFALGAGVMFLSLSPKIAEMAAEQIRMETFSTCMEDKIIGVESYSELMLSDVLSCADLILNEE